MFRLFRTSWIQFWLTIELKMRPRQWRDWFDQQGLGYFKQLGVLAWTCNPSKLEADIWGWIEVMRSAILHYSEPASALSLPPVWSHWGNPGVARCREMATLPAGYIPQSKVPSASSSGSLQVSLCVWSVVGWLIVYQLGILSLSCSQYSQTICWCGWDDNACVGVRNNSIGAWPNFLVWSSPWYCRVSPLLQTNKCILK